MFSCCSLTGAARGQNTWRQRMSLSLSNWLPRVFSSHSPVCSYMNLRTQATVACRCSRRLEHLYYISGSIETPLPRVERFCAHRMSMGAEKLPTAPPT